jgi:hypothetical protein
MSNNVDAPITKQDLLELKNFILDRETALIWKAVLLQVTLIGAISTAQWAVLFFVLQHVQWKAS